MLPQVLMMNHPNVAERNCTISISETENDEVYWNGSSSGELTTKLAFEHYREKGAIVPWMKHIWCRFIPPKFLSSSGN